MTKKILTIFILIFAFTSVSLEAQSRKKKKKSKKSDVEIIEFEDDRSNRSSRNRKQTNLTGMVLKTNPISNVFGWQFIEIERPVLPYFSAEAGLGLTFQPVINNSLLGVYGELIAEIQQNDEENNWGDFDIIDNQFDESIRKYGVGIYGSIAGNIYYYDDVMDGNFISIKLRYSGENNQVMRVEEGIAEVIRIEDDWDNEYKRNTDLVIGWGYQELYSRITLGYHVGFGYRFTNFQRQDLGREQNFAVSNGLYNGSRRTFRVEAGLRLGYQL